MSSSETFLEPSTNLQNLSIKFGKLDELYRVKDVIIAPPGRLLGEIDLSQAEAREAAYECEDALAIAQYEQDIDRYWYLAGAAFYDDPEHPRDPHDPQHKQQRDVGKMGLLAFQYGISARTWVAQTNHSADLTGVVVTQKTGERIERTFHELWTRYRPWWEETLELALTQGFLRNIYGRRRDFFARTDTPAALAALRREAVAFIPQSTIADHLNMGLERLYRACDPALIWIHAQIHDAVLFSCEPRDWIRAVRAVKSTLEFPMTVKGRELLVPAEVKISKGAWSAAREAA
jgi:DNA polymerase I-like protein with 3'-5' exonuclease and polymerase domains